MKRIDLTTQYICWRDGWLSDDREEGLMIENLLLLYLFITNKIIIIKNKINWRNLWPTTVLKF